jgi:hypothetical protein
MMRPLTLRIIAVALAFIAGFTAFLGYDLVFDRNVTDTFICQPSHNLGVDL